MNAKKHRRRAPKLPQKVDRGGQNRRAVEGKSNIAAKRVTLLPGFLINGFTSKTVQKVKAFEDSRKTKNPLLNDDLQAFLEQNGKHPRRSQRILKKHYERNSTTASITSSSGCDNLVFAPANISPQAVNNIPNNISFKSILKNNSKSIFKDIRYRFSKVNKDNTETVNQKPARIEENQNVNQSVEYMEEVSNYLNQNPQYLNQNQSRFEEVLPSDDHNLFKIELNRSFCRNLEKQICVTFKKNSVDECKENIKKAIETVKTALEGKLEIEKTVIYGSEDNQTESEPNDGPASKFYPVPAQNWVYSTPPNQKIGMAHIEECQLQAGVLCHNKNQQNLYEVKPSFNVDFSKLKHIESVPIDERFMTKVAQVRRTPANFKFRGYRGDSEEQNVFRQPWGDPIGCGGGGELRGQKESFVNPNFVDVIISRPTKFSRKSIFTPYHQEHMPTPQVIENSFSNVSELPDFTFIEEDNDFKMRQTRPAPEQRHKRRLSHEEFVVKQRNMFITEPKVCDKDKLFNFSEQERNIFDFGKV